MSNRHEVTTHPKNRFEHREGKGEQCEGCNSTYTRESYRSGVFRCPKCEAYYASFDILAQSYAVMLEEWRKKMGLSREAAFRQADDFHGLYDDIQNFLMDGYSMYDYNTQRRLESETEGVEA